MALIYKYRTGYRVVFTLKLPENTLRRQKYPKNKSEANVLRRQVERLEEATRTAERGSRPGSRPCVGTRPVILSRMILI